MSFQADQNLSEHLILFRDRPLIASVNWHWNRAAVVLCQEQQLAAYPQRGPRPNIGMFTPEFTAVLGELEFEHADEEAVVELLGAWIAGQGHTGTIALHLDLPPGAGDSVRAMVGRSSLAGRCAVLASPRRARRSAVWSAISMRLNLAMHEFRLVVHPSNAAGLAAELRANFEPRMPGGELAAVARRTTPLLDALAPYIAHRFVCSPSITTVDR